VTAERDAIGRAIKRLEEATIDDPPAYWQVLLDELEPFIDLDFVSFTSIAFNYVVTLRYRTGTARTPGGRASRIEDATAFFSHALQISRARA
jgi:hypothetical protein